MSTGLIDGRSSLSLQIRLALEIGVDCPVSAILLARSSSNFGMFPFSAAKFLRSISSSETSIFCGHLSRQEWQDVHSHNISEERISAYCPKIIASSMRLGLYSGLTYATGQPPVHMPHW